MKMPVVRKSPGRSWETALVAPFFLLLLSSSDVRACSCVPHPPPLDALASVDAVFHGKVLELVESAGFQQTAHFEVSEVWKGSGKLRIEVVTPLGGAACGVFFQVGSDYIVYAFEGGGDDRLRTNLCTRTRPYDREEAQALGDPPWTPPVKAEGFHRGDVDGSGDWDITDVIANLSFQFLGTFAPSCMDALDIDDSGELEITDPVAHLTHQFLGGSPPAAPFRECGEDPTDDGLSCDVYQPCAGKTETLYHVFDNGIRCLVEPCFSWTLRSSDEQVDVSGIDISPLGLSPEEEEKLVSELADGRRLVRGYLRDEPVGPGGVGKTLVITALPKPVGEFYHVEDSGITCVTWTCPYWLARADGDDEGVLFTDLDVRPLGLSDKEVEVLLRELFQGVWRVRGVLVKGPIGPAGLGSTLVVLELVERIGPPRIGPPEIAAPR